ncbi:hypothetical protein ACPPVO_53585 [Dactylosporangium sp. McL0621]|uniref:hypothetical protein n=1 Tax=Dactylosporangium sp. McL0621 TaxID=3415678 RepID=UPI003CEA0906
MQTALLRLLIAVPVAAVMLGVFRIVTQGYGRKPEVPEKPAAAPEEADPATGEPLRARGGRG